MRCLKDIYLSHGKKLGWIEVICGAMFSGKSEELIRRVRRAEIAKLKVKVYKPKVDKRYSDNQIVAHSGAKVEAEIVNQALDIILTCPANVQVVAIDEAQFFDLDLIEVCQRLADRGVRVIVAGLDQDFRGKPFGPMPYLLSIAEYVDKLQAICVKCGNPASRTQRLIDGKPAFINDPVVKIGAEELYEARCRKCHEVIDLTKQTRTLFNLRAEFFSETMKETDEE